jgi:hypothetical protein
MVQQPTMSHATSAFGAALALWLWERDRVGRRPWGFFMLGLGRRHEIDEEVMRHIAEKTGGEYYHIEDADKLTEVFENLSISPRPFAVTPTRDAESSVKITIGITSNATQSRSKPNQAPANSRVATAPAPIIPAAVSAAGPTKRVKMVVARINMSASHPSTVHDQHVAVHVIGRL